MQDGSKFIRFKPIDMFYTSEYMEQLCNLYNYEVSKESVEPLVLIGLFVLDFLCIHPFNDGNGRNAKWKKI